MADSRFITTVTFGGYDKEEVDARLETLYSQVFDLKNELREIKLLMEEYKKGTDEEKAHETVLSGERSMLTAAQVQKETLSDKLKAADDEMKAKDTEIASLREELEGCKAKLEESESKLSLLSAGSDASALGAILIGAQNAADAEKKKAAAEAEQIGENARKLAENTVAEANNKAKTIIYEAENRAAEAEAKISEQEEAAKVARGNLKTLLLADVEEHLSNFAVLRKTIESFEKNSREGIEQSEEMLKDAKAKLTADGIPEFSAPVRKEIKLPEIPELIHVDNTYPDPKAAAKKAVKKNDLGAIMEMADSLNADGGKDGSKAEEKPAETKADDKGGKKISLADLAKRASSLEDDD